MDQNKLKIEVARINKLEGSGKTRAFCDILLNDAFVIKGLRVVEGKNGIFVSMPREPGKDGKWYATFAPIKKEVREELDRIILGAYGA